MPQADFEKLLAEHTVTGAHFARLFLQHVLPPRFVRIRHDGLLSSRRRKDLDRWREVIGSPPATPRDKDPSWVVTLERFFGVNPLACPACKIGTMIVRQVVPPTRR